MSNKFLNLLVVMYCLATVLVPVFVLNKLIFLPLFCVSIYSLLAKPTKTVAPFIIVGIFFYGFFLAMVNEADAGFAQQMMFGSAALFLIYIIDAYSVDMGRALKFTGATLALAMCTFSFLLMVLPGSSIGEALLNYYNANELGFYGVRNFGGLQMFMLHHRSSPFLLVPLSLFFLDFLKEKRIFSLFFVCVILVAIVCSASRALMAMAVVSLSILYFSHKNLSMRILIIILVFPALAFFVGYLAVETSMFSSDEQSNSIKIGHMLSFFKVIDWQMLLFGQGLGAYFYTEGYGAIVSQTEITWMDSVRFVGLPLSIVLLITILFPVRKVAVDTVSSSSRLIMILYVIMSMSNPVMFNSFGFLVILWYWSIVIKRHESPIELRQKLGE
jgi:hypothetical protein